MHFLYACWNTSVFAKKKKRNLPLKFRLEEEEKFLNAESYYKKALDLDDTFKDAEDALQKLHKYMQVILYFLLEI